MSLQSWIADYAQQHGKETAAIEAATFSAANQPELSWCSAALVARLNPKLTAGALKNRLDPAVRLKPPPTAMRALLDTCQSNEQLRSAVVEIILNLGYPEIALAPTGKQVPAAAGWKHWLTVRETTLETGSMDRSKWTLSKNGQWTAQATSNRGTSCCAYPIEGNFELNVTAQQVSGAKFGIGYGGAGDCTKGGR